EARRGLRFPQQRLFPQRRAAARSHRLEGDRTAQLAIARLPDDAEAAASDLAHQLEAADHRAGEEPPFPGLAQLGLRLANQLLEQARERTAPARRSRARRNPCAMLTQAGPRP